LLRTRSITNQRPEFEASPKFKCSEWQISLRNPTPASSSSASTESKSVFK
jgi:hypothetical protein